nr:OpgC domain-containing protein [Roseibium litorale]
MDFFRGLGMFIIYIAHLPNSWWALWIPARFGYSDATEIFVFCSGMASAIAFGKVFDFHGLGLGTARILHRMWQVYWAHIGQFLVIASGLVVVQNSGYLTLCCNLDYNYVEALNLHRFFNSPETTLPRLLTLTYVPNYFDILPMYIVILGLVPVMMAVARFSVPAGFVLSVSLWLLANFGYLNLPAEPWSDRPWFFNPFAWQLIFFTGFAFMRGWIPAPPVDRRLVILAAVLVIGTIPLAWFRIQEAVPGISQFNADIEPLRVKTEFGILRFMHFLSLAYLAWVAAGQHGRRLLATKGSLWGKTVHVVQKVGQQSLPVFMASLAIAQAAAMLRDMAGAHDTLMGQILSNGLGLLALVAVAYVAGWFKSQPWRKQPVAPLSKPVSNAGPHTVASQNKVLEKA